ncbi:hypothetical protein V2J09_018336 [Rumex salicifolius]
MGSSGSRFTWSRGSDTNQFVEKRIDRVTMNMSAFLEWPNTSVRHLPRIGSDHSPLLLCLEPRIRMQWGRQPFRSRRCGRITQTSNPSSINLGTDTFRGTDLKEKLLVWNKMVFGRINEKKAKLTAELEAVQADLERSPTKGRFGLEQSIQMELAEVLWHEETMWLQKSREAWLMEGDRNTAFFHLTMFTRRKRNRVTTLRDEANNWIEEPSALENLVVSFYRELYSIPTCDLFPIVTMHNMFHILNNDVWNELDKDFSDREIHKAVKGMGRLKASRPDGFQPIFYHKAWGTVGPLVIREGLNDTLVTLIPKTSNPDKVNLDPLVFVMCYIRL